MKLSALGYGVTSSECAGEGDAVRREALQLHPAERAQGGFRIMPMLRISADEGSPCYGIAEGESIEQPPSFFEVTTFGKAMNLSPSPSFCEIWVLRHPCRPCFIDIGRSSATVLHLLHGTKKKP
jgi:hypothetical protein